MIAALYVQRGGVYWDLPGVDPWDIERDARHYAGPWPVVAHPPCQRWGRYWHGGPSAKARKVKGDDGGCFAAALEAVRRWGGVLEHPEASAAWLAFGLSSPPWGGAWVNADFLGGWTCCVEQGNYGHRARKATWLYAHSVELPTLKWGLSARKIRDGRRGARGVRQMGERLSKRERATTPPEMRDLLLSIAATALPQQRRAHG